MNTADFQQLVWNFYEKHGRDNLPWRQTNDPYAIYISEIMLQQTQASRVIPKYEAWMKHFPAFESVATAGKRDILEHWQGLGYNRRALYIKETAETIVGTYNGKLPHEEGKLLTLPGIGPYTAGALQAFVFQKPVVFVETNIRTVFIHHFFADKDDVSDATIKEKARETLPEEGVRAWYWALMDYGSHIKSEIGNLNRQSKTYQKQSEFSGSNRQLRAQMTRFILEHEPVTQEILEKTFQDTISDNKRMKTVATNLEALEKEGFITCNKKQITTSD